MSKEQLKINEAVEEIVAELLDDSHNINWNNFRIVKSQRLRSCQAQVVTVVNKRTGEVNYVLKSYKTYVAFVRDGFIYDFLRYVYDYTNTSGQHIAKFIRDFCPNAIKYTWR